MADGDCRRARLINPITQLSPLSYLLVLAAVATSLLQRIKNIKIMLSGWMPDVSSVPCWCDEYRVGNEWLDEQRRKLLEISSRACRVFAAPTVNSADFRDLLCDFAEALQAHLAFEEEALVSNDYPYLASHVEDHNAIRVAVAKLLCKANNRPFYRKELLKFMADFTNNHVLATNIACKDYLKCKSSDLI